MNLNLTLFGQALAFGIFVWFTWKFVWPPLLKAIEDRQKLIADGLAAGEKGKQELAIADRKSNEALTDARTRAGEILAQAERRAAQIVEEAKSTAKVEGDRLIAGAKAETQQDASRAKEQLRDQVAALAVAGAEKILRREVDANAHAELLDQLKREF